MAMSVSLNLDKLKNASDYLLKVPFYWIILKKKQVDDLIKTTLKDDANSLSVEFNV
ncbi:MAG: hypothetical protein PWQ17_169 [Anaerophaga sp.]|nr:hypothetical protein [Anaerophaga sp.]